MSEASRSNVARPRGGSVSSTSYRFEWTGNPDPVSLHTTGFELNSETCTWISAVDVTIFSGWNQTEMSTVPLAGMMPATGSMWNSSAGPGVSIMNSNWMGTLHPRVTVRRARRPTSHRPKSIAEGNLASFMVGYAWMGTSRFSSSEWTRMQS